MWVRVGILVTVVGIMNWGLHYSWWDGLHMCLPRVYGTCRGRSMNTVFETTFPVLWLCVIMFVLVGLCCFV